MYPKVLFLILFPLFAYSQAPQKINFQSVLRNSVGEVLSNKTVAIRISILSGSATGTNVYAETHSKTTDASGLMSIQIGNGTVVSGLFSTIEWGSTAHFIKLEADFNGGTNFVLLGTQELMSVPYALYASKTDTSSLNLVNRFSYLQNQIELLSSYTSLLASGLVDIDGNNYPVVKIGNQIWMKENLRVSRYNNGDVIPVVTDNAEWRGFTNGKRSWYNNDSSTYEIPYGNLYNSYAVKDNRNICPSGWHVPSDGEWTTLVNYLGGESVAGGKMKTIGTAYWESPNTGAINLSGFSALPGGYRNFDGSFVNVRNDAFFWSAAENANIYAWLRNLFSSNGNVGRLNSYGVESVGASVRCLRD